MRRFTALFTRLDQSNATNDKIAAMTAYLADAPPQDAAWAVWFLSGRRLKRLIKRAELVDWALRATGHPRWLLDETYQSVGDMAETIALLLPEPSGAGADVPLSTWAEERLAGLPQLDAETRASAVCTWWAQLPTESRFVLNKMMTGALRLGVSQRLVIRALAAHLEIDAALIAHRMMGDWQPSPEFMARLESGNPADAASLPYPFYLASPLEGQPVELGTVGAWQVEWKWDGIRAQLIRRAGGVYLWSRGEERLDGRFPELEAAARALPDGTVLDGEILARGAAGTFRFAALQRRIGRLKPGARLLAEVPATFMAYDLLESAGSDWRDRSLDERRSALLAVAGGDPAGPIVVSRAIVEDDWEALARRREESRARGVEGFVLKRRSSPYRVGRRRGDWWKWKIDPLTVDAVLIYAQPGSGRRSNLLTDYTFAVWDDGRLVTVCKAYSGLDNTEIAALDRWIRKNTIERFGPVRAVTPHHVFEIAFEGVQRSKRHKSGVAFRFPRILRWRTDLAITDAESLAEVRALIDE